MFYMNTRNARKNNIPPVAFPLSIRNTIRQAGAIVQQNDCNSFMKAKTLPPLHLFLIYKRPTVDPCRPSTLFSSNSCQNN
jgi:hypothetical protein